MGKPLSTVLKTSEFREGLAEFTREVTLRASSVTTRAVIDAVSLC